MLNPLAWISAVLGRCPRCGSPLQRVIATEESYARKTFTSYVRRGRPPLDGLDTAIYQITPVYSVCSRCGFRIRRRDLKTRVR